MALVVVAGPAPREAGGRSRVLPGGLRKRGEAAARRLRSGGSRPPSQHFPPGPQPEGFSPHEPQAQPCRPPGRGRRLLLRPQTVRQSRVKSSGSVAAGGTLARVCGDVPGTEAAMHGAATALSRVLRQDASAWSPPPLRPAVCPAWLCPHAASLRISGA